MKRRDKKIAEEFKNKISQIVPLFNYKVYGSMARGDNDKYSDLDVFVEVEIINRELKEKISEAAWEVGFEYLIHISPLIFTRFEIEDSPLRASPILESINKDGISL